jgi:hypothetical protein
MASSYARKEHTVPIKYKKINMNSNFELNCEHASGLECHDGGS